MVPRSGWARAAGNAAAGTRGLGQNSPLHHTTSPALACPQPPQRGLRETLPFPGHDPKSFTRVPAPAAFPSQDFALIW